MAHATIQLTNGIEVKNAPVGFSWTTLLFGFCPALFRQDWLIAAVVLVLTFLTSGLFPIVFAFIYNKMYIKGLIKQGYVVSHSGGLTDDFLKAHLGLVNVPR